LNKEEKNSKLLWIRHLLLDLMIMGLHAVLCYVIAEKSMAIMTDLMGPGKYRVLFNVIWYFMADLLFYALSLRLGISMLGGSFFTVVFAAANIYVMRFRTNPIYMTDLTAIDTAAEVAGDYDYTPNAGIILLIVFLLVMLVIAILLRRRVLARGWKIHVLCILVYTLLFGGLMNYTMYSKDMRRRGVSVRNFNMVKAYRNSGGLLVFMRSARNLFVEKPDGYSLETVGELDQTYTSDSVSEEEYNRPNVIVVMNEAFADLQAVGDFETNEEVLPFLNSLTENTVKGMAYTSVFGGHTPNTEYEFLTGDTMAYLPNGCTPYQSYLKHAMPSLTSNLKKDGYQGILAMHPYKAKGYNRPTAYKNLGFNEFITEEAFAGAQLVRRFVSDEADYEKVISEYEKARTESDEPFYMLNVTMQNHSSYDEDFDNLPDTIKITSEGVADQDKAERYLNLVHLSDQALETLISYFEGIEDPTVIVFFGDHEPGLSKAFYESIIPDDAEEMAKYKVPFFIWANFDIEEQSGVKTSVNFLQTLMLKACGMKMTGYNKFQLELMETLPVVTAAGIQDSEGNYYSTSDTDIPSSDLLSDYAILVYNHLFDRNNRAGLFDLAD